MFDLSTRVMRATTGAAASFGRLGRSLRRQPLTGFVAREDVDAHDRQVAATTHDLLNVLSGVVGYLELMEDAPASDASQSLQRQTRHLARRLGALGQDLMVLTTTEGLGLEVRPEAVEVLPALMEAVSVFPGLDVRLDAEEGQVVYADPLRLHQMLVNLLSNAQRHGRPPVRVTVRSQESMEAGIVIEVSDAGLGIPHAFLPRLFAWRSQAAGTSSPGEGIGLSTARELAGRQGGSLTYHPEGNVFALTLPSSTPASSTPASSTPASSTHVSSGGARPPGRRPTARVCSA